MNSMSGKPVIDTNVLIYAHDTDAGAKHQIAKTVLRDLWSERTAFFSSPLSKELARLVVSSYAIWCTETLQLKLSRRIEDASRIVSGMPRLFRLPQKTARPGSCRTIPTLGRGLLAFLSRIRLLASTDTPIERVPLCNHSVRTLSDPIATKRHGMLDPGLIVHRGSGLARD